MRFEAPAQGVPAPFHVSILLAEPNSAQQWVGRRIGLDTRSTVWLPLLFGGAFAFSFARGLRHRCRALALTFLAVGSYSAGAIGNSIALEAAGLGWWSPASTILAGMAWIDDVTVNQLGPAFIVPMAAASLCISFTRPREPQKKAARKGGLVVIK